MINRREFLLICAAASAALGVQLAVPEEVLANDAPLPKVVSLPVRAGGTNVNKIECSFAANDDWTMQIVRTEVFFREGPKLVDLNYCSLNGSIWWPDIDGLHCKSRLQVKSSSEDALTYISYRDNVVEGWKGNELILSLPAVRPTM